MQEIHPRPDIFKTDKTYKPVDLSGPLGMVKTQRLLNMPDDVYVDFVKGFSIHLFDKDEREDFRCLISFGHKALNHSYKGENNLFVGVKNDGRFVSGMMMKKGDSLSHDQIFITSIGDFDMINIYKHYLTFDFLNSPQITLPQNKKFFSHATKNIHYRRIIYGLKLSMIDKIEQARTLIFDSLDKDIQDFILEFNLSTRRDVEWLTGGDMVDADIVKARRQMTKTYPILLNALDITSPRDYSGRILHHIIDSKKPLIPELARHFNVNKNRIKRLNGLNFKDFRELACDFNMKRLIDNILDIPEKLFPKDKSILPAIHIIDDYADVIYKESPSKLLERLARHGNPWRYIEKMKQYNAHDIGDAVDFLYKKLFLPAALNKTKNHAEKTDSIWFYEHENTSEFINFNESLKAFMLDEFTMKNLFDLSDRYHRNIFRYENMLSDQMLYDGWKWKPIIGIVKLESGYVARELSSSLDFKIQGRRENHCVGGYASTVLEGLDNDYGTLVFSIEKNKKIESTVEIRYQKDRSEFTAVIIQNKTKSNHMPAKEIKEISNRLLKKINDIPFHQWESYLDDLHESKNKYIENKNIDELSRSCGYLPWNREMLNRAWDELKMVLPARLRHAGLDGFIDEMPIEYNEFFERVNKDERNPWDVIEKENHVEMIQNSIY